MKIFTSFMIAFLFTTTVVAQQAEFKFEKEVINYGKIAQDSDGVRTFVFTNIGKEPLIISNIQSACGCTVPKKPEAPIMPGKKGEIKVAYDTHTPGGFSKAITIFSNAKTSRKIVKIKGYVMKKQTSPEKEKSMLSNSK